MIINTIILSKCIPSSLDRIFQKIFSSAIRLMAFTSMFDILYISLTLNFLLELYFTESHFIKTHSFSMWLLNIN